MTIYGYKCPSCGQMYTSSQRVDRLSTICQLCGHMPLHRDYSGIQVIAPMQEHWNKTVNQPISSMQQFKDALHRESDRLSMYTQVEQRLELLDPEQARQGVTEQGLDSTNRQRVKHGLSPINLDKL